MSRYIDADALIEEIERCSYETWSKDVNRAWWAKAVKVKDNIKACIKRQPTANVAPIADTVREIVERLKAGKFTHKNFGELVYVDAIDQIEKEMLEGADGK